jgi:hypothetical protein
MNSRSLSAHIADSQVDRGSINGGRVTDRKSPLWERLRIWEVTSPLAEALPEYSGRILEGDWSKPAFSI